MTNQTDNKVARYRTINKCYEEIKQQDNCSVITKCYIRKLCKEGKIKCFSSGSRILVNFDSLLAFLNGEPP